MIKSRVPHQPLLALIAAFSAVAFFLASNYCNVEAFVPHAHPEESPSHAAADRHDPHGDSTPNHDNHDETTFCCDTIQAITASRFDVQLHPITNWILTSLELKSIWVDSLIGLPGLASGLSPPARAPTPTVPFYRTAYASLAPPAHLA